MLFPSTTAQAQTQYSAKDGIAAATKNAKDSLAPDAVLTFIGTTGALERLAPGTTLPITIQYDLNTGKSSAWIYVFYSPSTSQNRMVGVVSLGFLGYLAFGLGQLPLPIPGSQNVVDMTKTYSNSDKMMTKLKTDTAFTRYRTQFPTMPPTLVFLGDFIANDSLKLPGGFPISEQMWTTNFVGGGDSSMTCLVSTQTGATFCQRIAAPTLGTHDIPVTPAYANMFISPNPSNGSTRVSIVLPAAVSPAQGVTVALFNAGGARVMDLTESFVMNDFHAVDFSTVSLPSGTYFCRIAGPGWQSVSDNIVVTK